MGKYSERWEEMERYLSARSNLSISEYNQKVRYRKFFKDANIGYLNYLKLIKMGETSEKIEFFENDFERMYTLIGHLKIYGEKLRVSNDDSETAIMLAIKLGENAETLDDLIDRFKEFNEKSEKY